jgi:(2Fe-2S) ferredoxin
MSSPPDLTRVGLTRVVLLARTANTAVPLKEMEGLRDIVAAMPNVAAAAFAFSEEGIPSLRAVLMEWIEADGTPIVIVPLLLPSEPNFAIWIRRTVARWQLEQPPAWPEIRLAPFPGSLRQMRDLLAALVTSSEIKPLTAAKPAGTDGSLVPAQKRRVLVCMGGPCHAVGASVIWGHLRNEQTRLALRTTGDGTMTAKTSCLGPCSLAPVVQVWPEGTIYGGVDESAIDSIIDGHLLKGEIVERFAYAPTGAKHRLR